MTMVKPSQVTSKFVHWWDTLFQYRYYFLLCSLMAMLVLPSFSDETNEGIIWTVARTAVLVSCINVLRNLNHSMVLLVVLGLLASGSDWLGVLGIDSNYTNLLSLGLFAFFVGMISYEVFKQILISKSIDMHIIIGALCGFMLIGMIASLVFTLVHITYPESFSNVSQGMNGVDDLFYFSYITILSIGYGDIAPISSQARGVSLFFGLIGQFYLAVIMAVLVGKFISKPNR